MKACGGQSTNFAKLYKNAAFTRYSLVSWARAPALSRIAKVMAQMGWRIKLLITLSSRRVLDPDLIDLIGPASRFVSHVFLRWNDKAHMSRSTLLLGVALALVGGLRAQDPTPPDPAGRNLDSLSIEQLMQVKVQSAAMHPQTLKDAPASVTVITAEDIRKYGYRTLAEALASVRGFYVTNDRSYETIGVRGFSLPGDYDSHILVMVNGHNMADNIFGYMLYTENDFPIEMNLIKQIEIIRGPSSALYGSNAIFATINIITKPPAEAGPLTLTVDTGSFGEKKGQIDGGRIAGERTGSFLRLGIQQCRRKPAIFSASSIPRKTTTERRSI